MKIQDARGRELNEATVQLEPEEVTDLLVSASQLDDGSVDHAVLRDTSGTALALYCRTEDLEPLERQVDWWLGPAILLVVVLMAVGAFTIARGILGMLF